MHRMLTVALTLLAISAPAANAGLSPTDAARITLVFDIDQGFGNGIIVHDDQVGLVRILDALAPLKPRYDVCVLVNPMVADRKKFDRVLDTLAARRTPFMFDVYTSSGQTLGSCSTQNAPHDPRHGVTISLSDLAHYKSRYGKWLAGLRFMEVFSQDFTVRAVRTTNPEWAMPCWKLPNDSFFQPSIAEGFLRFAKKHRMFVQWSDWHWFEFAAWDAPQKRHEEKLSAILRKFPGIVTVTYANNEPSENSAQRLDYWEKSVAKFVKDGAAGYGLSDQSWLRENEETCPVEDIIAWAKSAIGKGCRYIQFEPAWYFFKLPRGTFCVENYTKHPAWVDRGRPRENFIKLSAALLAAR